MSDKVEIDLNRLTLGEMAKAEELGADFEKPNSLKTIMALIFVVRKRSNPDVTFEEIQNLTMDDVSFVEQKLDPKDTKNSDSE